MPPSALTKSRQKATQWHKRPLRHPPGMPLHGIFGLHALGLRSLDGCLLQAGAQAPPQQGV